MDDETSTYRETNILANVKWLKSEILNIQQFNLMHSIFSIPSEHWNTRQHIKLRHEVVSLKLENICN